MTFLCTWNNPFSTHIDLISKAVEGSDCKKWQPADRRPAAMGTPAPQVQRERELDAPVCILHFGFIVLLLTLAFLLPFLTGTSQTCSSLLRLTASPRPCAVCSSSVSGRQGLSFSLFPPRFAGSLLCSPPASAGSCLCLRQLDFFPLCLSSSISRSLSLCLSVCLSVSLCSFVSSCSVSLSLCFFLCFLLCCAQLLSHV